jgi:hypothetical protein
MSRPSTSSFQRGKIDRQIQEINYDEFCQQAVDELGPELVREDGEVREGRFEDLKDNLQILGTAVAVADVFEETGIDYVEEGGVAVMAYAVSEAGPEGAAGFRQFSESPTHDTDKVVRPGECCRDGRTIDSVLEREYDASDENGSVSESMNGHHDGRKLTVQLEAAYEEFVECDFMRPECESDEKYSFDNSEEVEIADSSIKVPPLRELLTEKLGAYADNNRDKDLEDIKTLLWASENRYESGEGTKYSMRRLYSFAEGSERHEADLEQVLQEAADDIRQDIDMMPHTPSKSYLENILYSN